MLSASLLAPSWISLTLLLPVSSAMAKLRQVPQLRRSIYPSVLPEADVLVSALGTCSSTSIQLSRGLFFLSCMLTATRFPNAQSTVRWTIKRSWHCLGAFFFWHVGAEVMTLSTAEVGMVIRFEWWKTWTISIKTLLPQLNGHWTRFTRYKKQPAAENRSSNPGGQCLSFAHLRCHFSISWSHSKS